MKMSALFPIPDFLNLFFQSAFSLLVLKHPIIVSHDDLEQLLGSSRRIE